ncbi:tyrosine-type recombinase/integrase [Exiguobacterium flavidum]|uniref:tyrosine-type recombinase/integrase n=1 Tax=Exiguobacterium flavidum TaxID=2184695 RepID=UPI000DF7B808|nr:tyrosine-type recombinase/integrase [Exiguobacterium flavidum]
MNPYHEAGLKMIEEHCTGHTAVNYRSDWNRYCARCASIAPKQIEQFLREEQRTKQPATVNRLKNALSSIFKQLCEAKIVKKNPILAVKHKANVPQRQFHVFSWEEVRRATNRIDDPAVHLFYTLLRSTGMRFSEARSVKINDIRFSDRHIDVRYGKGNKSREVPLSLELEEEIKTYLDEARPNVDSDDLFVTKAGALMNEKMLRRRMREVSLTEFNRVIKPHDLRRTFATTLYQQTKDLKSIQVYLGHGNIETTIRYIGLDKHHIIDSIDWLNEEG